MSQSLAPQCTPLKQTYDACFNSWFEGYLEPAIAAAAAATDKDQHQRVVHSKKKADEFQEKCGKIWEEYRACVQEAVKEKGLDKLLQQAREENPLVEPVPPPASSSKR